MECKDYDDAEQRQKPKQTTNQKKKQVLQDLY